MLVDELKDEEVFFKTVVFNYLLVRISSNLTVRNVKSKWSLVVMLKKIWA